MATINQQLLVAAHLTSLNLNFQIPPISIKLDRDNYTLWRTNIISALECFKLDSFNLNPTPPPETIPPTVDPDDVDDDALFLTLHSRPGKMGHICPSFVQIDLIRLYACHCCLLVFFTTSMVYP